MPTKNSTSATRLSSTPVASRDTTIYSTSMPMPADDDSTTDAIHEPDFSDDDDTTSETSTTRHEHEPYESFQHKVAGLVAEKFGCTTSAVRTEHIKGGTFNRVVGVEVRVAKTKRNCFGWAQKLLRNLLGKPAPIASKSYIVRIARDEQDGADCRAQVAVLKAISGRLSVPTPQVVHYDMLSDNVFKKPYMIQKLIPGKLLSLLLEDLNLEQKKCLVRNHIDLITQVASVEAAPGDISVDNITLPANATIHVNKVSCSDTDAIPATSQKSINHMVELCDMWREEQTTTGRFCFEAIWDGFSAICRSLERRGFLEGPCVLVHGDLREYNMLAKVINSTTVNITGIIDWDDAHFAPKFMALRSPFWLWMPESDATDTEDERNAHLEPTSDEDRVLQRVFLENASEEYKRFAFAPESFLARRMYAILRNGMHCDWDIKQAEAIIREWAVLHPEDNVPIGEEYLN